MNQEIEKWLEEMEQNFQKLIEEDNRAKERGQLIGRYIAEPYADGKAYYKIIGETKTTVKIRVITGIGDDWIIPYWGVETNIDKNYVKNKLEFRDYMDGVFSKKKG